MKEVTKTTHTEQQNKNDKNDDRSDDKSDDKSDASALTQSIVGNQECWFVPFCWVAELLSGEPDTQPAFAPHEVSLLKINDISGSFEKISTSPETGNGLAENGKTAQQQRQQQQQQQRQRQRQQPQASLEDTNKQLAQNKAELK